MTPTPEEIKQAVKARYGAAARRAAASTDCCSGDPAAPTASACCDPAGFGASAYGDLAPDEVPDTARLASLGCGNPTAIAGLQPGQRVLDLGSGGGLDVLLAARQVGPEGFVYGLDMTEEMLVLARANQQQAGVANAEFIKGDIEAIPLPDASVDVVISNCVLNLSADKPAAFREAHRVLAPGGRLAVTDIVAARPLTKEERADLAAWAGCLAGAITAREYVEGLEAAGFSGIEVIPTHPAGPTAVSAVIRATA
ncbi:MAG TPA: arsenite methyltransferase [Acidimicrobiia bacterium]|nr:arsenite methyltransferase [Acidimicrobiia bacterium]